MTSKEITTQNDAPAAVDAALVEGCRSGERDAQQRLYEVCHRDVYRLIVRMVGLQDATDVTQQVFLQMYRKIGQFEGRASFKTWLHRLAVNEARQAASSVDPFRHSSFRAAKLFSLAATALIAIGIGWFAYQSWTANGEPDIFTVDFGHYLEEFAEDPDAAQQLLLAKYVNQRVDVDRAIQQVGYRPAVADGLPDGYSVESTYVMEMPCCNCVQCLCKRSDGSTLVIFEHDDDETKEWFGDRPESSTECNGKRCTLVELSNQLAGSWKHGKRYITILGVRDVAEMTRLAAWFDGRVE
jgi:RNA polymerase sigma factor (sigma-70 family)